MKTNTEFKAFLKKHDACNEALRWLEDRTPEQTFKDCHRGDWLMFWISKGVKDKLPGYPKTAQIKKAALEIARLVLKYTKDDRVKKGLDMVEDYLNTGNKETINEAKKILSEARKAAAAYAYADEDAYADAAAAADADAAAAAAADAAAAAAADAYAYAAADAARKEVRQKSAEIIRQYCKIDFN